VFFVILMMFLSEGYHKKFENSYENQNLLKFQAEECPIRLEKNIVRGNSLSGLIEHGTEIDTLFGYYDCREVQRNDIVLYWYGRNDVPLIKIVRGIPNDHFNLGKTIGGWNILINGEVLKNSMGEPYLISERKQQMLSLYENDYNGIIPPDSYLILSNVASGGIDSTFFGLVHKEDILAKVEI